MPGFSEILRRILGRERRKRTAVADDSTPWESPVVSFGLRLHRQLAAEMPNSNLFLSPVSIGVSLAVAANGARGETRNSITRVLDPVAVPAERPNSASHNLLGFRGTGDGQIELRLCTSLWVDHTFPVRPEFVESSLDSYWAKVTNVNFASPGTTHRINQWVSDQTAGKIESIVGRPPLPGPLLLLNAIYFRGEWQRLFDASFTQQRTFHAVSGPRKHPMMTQSGEYNYLEGEKFQAIALPYRGGQVALYVFLPHKRSSLEKFLSRLDGRSWSKWMGAFGREPGEIVLPKFQLSCDLELDNALRALGMEQAFDPQRADFSGISSERTWLGEARHRTLVELDERGTEAVAVAEMGMMLGLETRPPPPFRMVVDRPFFFAIRDQNTGLLLFVGSVFDPEVLR